MNTTRQYHEYARRQIQEIIIARHKGSVMIDGDRICDAVPYPAPLHREREFKCNVFMLVGFAYSVPWLYFGFQAFAQLQDGPIYHQWAPIWRGLLALFFGWYHIHAAEKRTGLFYPLDLWEQSLEVRETDFRNECHRIYRETSPQKSN